MNKLEKYNSIITTLQNNDRNATYNEILKDVEGDLDEAITELKECLTNVINEEEYEGEELDFYVTQLNRVNNISID